MAAKVFQAGVLQKERPAGETGINAAFKPRKRSLRLIEQGKNTGDLIVRVVGVTERFWVRTCLANAPQRLDGFAQRRTDCSGWSRVNVPPFLRRSEPQSGFEDVVGECNAITSSECGHGDLTLARILQPDSSSTTLPPAMTSSVPLANHFMESFLFWSMRTTVQLHSSSHESYNKTNSDYSLANRQVVTNAGSTAEPFSSSACRNPRSRWTFR